MFKIGDYLTPETYTAGAIWATANNAVINPLTWQIEAKPEPTKEDVEAIRRQLYITEVDPLTAHINRLRDEELTPEIASTIAKLVEERKQVVARIKEENPYPAEPVVEEPSVEPEPAIEEPSVVELYSMEI